MDKCPECKTQISLFKMFNNELVYEFCFKCGFKLVNSRINYVKNGLTYKLNCKLINILKKGYIQLGDYYIYSFLFFVSFSDNALKENSDDVKLYLLSVSSVVIKTSGE